MKSRQRKSRKKSRGASKRSRTKVSRRSLPRRVKSPRKRSRNEPRKTKSRCQSYLKRKIKTNMNEYKKGRFSSRAQALAVSYSQTKKKLPYCSRYLKQRK